MEITTNPIIPRKVDQVVEDPDARAVPAVAELYLAGINVDHIFRLLSIGLLGKKRKLVPTRWSITASDDLIGKSLKEAVLDKPLIGSYQLYSGEDLGNHFEILFLPGTYSFEMGDMEQVSGRLTASSAPTAKGQWARRITAPWRAATMRPA